MRDKERLTELLDRYFDDAATAAETRELNDLLRSDQTARRSFWQAAELQAQLRAAAQLAQPKEPAAAETKPRLATLLAGIHATLRRAAEAIRWRTHPGRFAAEAALIAALAAGLGVLIWLHGVIE